MTEILEEAHKRSSRHRAEVLASTTCGCFYCRPHFPRERYRNGLILVGAQLEPRRFAQTAVSTL